MLAHRLRRWANIKSMLGRRFNAVHILIFYLTKTFQKSTSTPVSSLTRVGALPASHHSCRSSRSEPQSASSTLVSAAGSSGSTTSSQPGTMQTTVSQNTPPRAAVKSSPRTPSQSLPSSMSKRTGPKNISPSSSVHGITHEGCPPKLPPTAASQSTTSSGALPTRNLLQDIKKSHNYKVCFLLVLHHHLILFHFVNTKCMLLVFCILLFLSTLCHS